MKNKFNIGDRVSHKFGDNFIINGIKFENNIFYYSDMPSAEFTRWSKEENLELYKEKKKITLYRDTYKHNDYIWQSIWSSHNDQTDFKVVKTETKEIEIDGE